MNAWNEPYPITINDLIQKCDRTVDSILSTLEGGEVKTLSDFYKSEKNETRRLKKVFENVGYKPNTKLSAKAKENNEIKGLYVFAEVLDNRTMPRYVGISGSIFRRLKQHGWGKLDNEATLAYLQAARRLQHTDARKHLPYAEILAQQNIIRQYKVVIIPEIIDFDLYFMEVYIAGKLKTTWNSFRTH